MSGGAPDQGPRQRRVLAGKQAALDRAVELLELDAAERARRRGLNDAGYLDLLDGELPSTGATQDLMLTRLVPAIYERYWRPALSRVAKGFTGPGMAEELRIARLLLGLGEGDAVLDVACGPGNFSREFARAVGRDGLVVGVDASQTMLERGGEELRRADPGNLCLVRASATELPFAGESFDAAVLTFVLCSVSDPAQALAEVRRVLRPGAPLVLLEHVRGDGRLARWQDRLTPLHRRLAGGCHLNRDTRAAVAACGFDVAAVERTRLPASHRLVSPGIQGRAIKTSS